MRMFFVDLENINASALESIQRIAEGDRYYIFYSDACISISSDAVERIRRQGGTVKLCKVKNGISNALDFQLSSYLGYVINQGIYGDCEYIIVSCDKGYDVVCDFWREKGICTYRISCFTNTTKPRKTISTEELSPYLDRRTVLYEADILQALNNTGSAQCLYANLGKIFRNARHTGILYRKIKPLFLSQFSDTETPDATGKEPSH